MTEEPYRWLEAIGNRREYIREQLKGGTPVFAVSRPEGILLLGVGQGQSKVFEIYDRHAYAALGHPVDIERIRQAAIEAAHLEGFNRSAKDVTLRRLISFSLSGMLKTAFEQIFSPPLILESIFAELGGQPNQDVLVRLHYDGDHHYESSGIVLSHHDLQAEAGASKWLHKMISPEDSLQRVAELCLTAWQALVEGKSFEALTPSAEPKLDLGGKSVESALLDRRSTGAARYHPFRLNSAPKA
jgi:proteasome alpha subunit